MTSHGTSPGDGPSSSPSGRPLESGVVAAVDTEAPVDTARGPRQELAPGTAGGSGTPTATPPRPKSARPPGRWRRRLLVGALLGAAGATTAVLLARRGEIRDALDPPLETVKIALVDTAHAGPIHADIALQLPSRHRVTSSSPRRTSYLIRDELEPQLGYADLAVSLSAAWPSAQATVDAHMTRGEEIVDVGPWPPHATSYVVTFQFRLGSRVGIEVVQAGARGGAVTCTAELNQSDMPRKRKIEDVLPRLRALCAFVPE